MRENVIDCTVNMIPDVVTVKIPRHVSVTEHTDFVTEAPFVIGWIVVVMTNVVLAFSAV